MVKGEKESKKTNFKITDFDLFKRSLNPNEINNFPIHLACADAVKNMDSRINSNPNNSKVGTPYVSSSESSVRKGIQNKHFSQGVLHAFFCLLFNQFSIHHKRFQKYEFKNLTDFLKAIEPDEIIQGGVMEFNEFIKAIEIPKLFDAYVYRVDSNWNFIIESKQIENKEKSSEDEILLEDYLNKLNVAYQNFDLELGIEIAKEAISIFPFQIDITRWWILFHNRKTEWHKVRTNFKKRLKENINSDLKAEISLGIFESYLNEYMKNKHLPKSFNALIKQKGKYLDLIDNKELNGKYHYFMTRFYEVEWLNTPREKKQSNTSLYNALVSINKSIDLYTKDRSGYQKNYTNPWWLYAHKAIIYKLWGHRSSKEAIEQFGEGIMNELFEKNGLKKKSLQVYAITYFLLLGDSEKLSSFLLKLKENGITKNINELDNYTFHHIDLLFHKEEDSELRKKMTSVITEWFQNKEN